jgi:hypothetical protein
MEIKVSRYAGLVDHRTAKSAKKTFAKLIETDPLRVYHEVQPVPSTYGLTIPFRRAREAAVAPEASSHRWADGRATSFLKLV